MKETRLRQQIVSLGASLFRRGYSYGSSGNISVRLEDGILITPTNSCMGRLDPSRIAKVSRDGGLLAGDEPSKEVFLHRAVYDARPEANAVVHLHSPHAVAVSCLAEVDPEDALPPLTPYYVMRVGKLPLLPYFRPGARALAEAVGAAARGHCALLLANHGQVVAGKSLDAAVCNAEEVEEAARLFLLLQGKEARLLTDEQVSELRDSSPGRPGSPG